MDAGADFHTGTEHLGIFGTTSIPVPNTSVSSVRHKYWYRKLRWARYDIPTGTENSGTVPSTRFFGLPYVFFFVLTFIYFFSLCPGHSRERVYFVQSCFFASFCYFVLFHDLLVFSFKLAYIFDVIGALYADRSFTFFLEYFAIMLVYLFHILRPHHLYQSLKFVQAERILGVLSASYVVWWQEREDNNYFFLSYTRTFWYVWFYYY